MEIDNTNDTQNNMSMEADDTEDYKVLEESPCGRWNKCDSEITVQKLLDFDSTHVGIDTEKGDEIAWNEMKFCQNPKTNFHNRFESSLTLKSIYEKLKGILEFLLKLDHSNILKFYDYWFDENEIETKIVVITEYSTAGSLKKALDKSKLSQTKVKASTAKRWLNQILYSIRYLHSEKISIFQGFISSETIFIQNSCVIKLTPTLLRLSGVCEISKNNTIRRSNSPFSSSKNDKTKPKVMKLTDEIVQKDINSIGNIALEIFTAHLKSKRSTTPMIKSPNFCEDFLENDFVTKCFEFDMANIDSIWYHPFINNIYSLKVLSVYSILVYFQENNMSVCSSSSKKSILSDSDDAHLSENVSEIAEIDNSLSDEDSTSTQAHSSSSELFNQQSKSSSSLNQSFKANSSGTLKQRRKVSLSFLTNFNNITIPQDFFSILGDIRYGLYPRLFTEIDYKELSKTPIIKTITSSSCLEFIMQQKQIIDIRSSLLNINNVFLNDINERKDHSVSTIVLPSLDSEICNKNDETFCDNNTSRLDNNLVKELIETRRISSEICTVNIKDEETQVIELNLTVRFDDNSQRYLQCYFPNNFFVLIENFEDLTKEFDINNSDPVFKTGNEIEQEEVSISDSFDQKIANICLHLTNELVDYGLVNEKDHMTIHELFTRTIKDYVL